MSQLNRIARNLLAGTLSVALSTPAFADPNIVAKAAATPPEGYQVMTWQIEPQVIPTTRDRTYYWANQASTVVGGHAVYTGLIPRTTQDHLVIFSAFGKGTEVRSPNCNQGADGGNGTSCRIKYKWPLNQRYELKITRRPDDKPGSTLSIYEGQITNLKTRQTQIIGTIAVPTEWGGLQGRAYLFDEYFPFNGGPKEPALRECTPYARYRNWLPVFVDASGKKVPTTGGTVRVHTGQDKCAVAAGKPNLGYKDLKDGSYLLENGTLTAQYGGTPAAAKPAAETPAKQ